MKVNILRGIDGKEVKELTPENEEDEAELRRMAREGKLGPDDWLHREPPSAKRDKPEEAA